jgi:hypothetical protein
MKTPMQELIDKLEYLQRTNPNKLFIEQGIHHGLEAAIKEAKSLLEKEKEMIENIYVVGYSDGDNGFYFNDDYYDKTFNTSEK